MSPLLYLASLNVSIGQLIPFAFPVCGIGLVFTGTRLLFGSEEYIQEKAALIGTKKPAAARIIGFLVAVVGIGMVAIGAWMLFGRSNRWV